MEKMGAKKKKKNERIRREDPAVMAFGNAFNSSTGIQKGKKPSLIQAGAENDGPYSDYLEANRGRGRWDATI